MAGIVGVAAMVGLLALVLSQSRGGWVGAAAGLVAVVWLSGGAMRWVAIFAAAAVLLLVTLTPTGGRVSDRFAGDIFSLADDVQVTPANFAARERLAHWRAGLAMVRAHPVLGVGGGNFQGQFRDATSTWRFRISRGHAHNAYIQAAAQSGLLGLATYLTLWVTVGWRLARGLRRAGDGPSRPLVVGAIGVSVAFSVHSIVDYLHVLSLGVQLSAVWAMAEVAWAPAAAGPGRVWRLSGR